MVVIDGGAIFSFSFDSIEETSQKMIKTQTSLLNTFSLLHALSISLLHAKGTTIKKTHLPPCVLSEHTASKKSKHTRKEKGKEKRFAFTQYIGLAFGFFASSFALTASRCASDSGVLRIRDSHTSRRQGKLSIRKSSVE